MKKSLKLIIVSLVLTFISCEKTDLTQSEENTTAPTKAVTPPPNLGYSDVKSWSIDNGILPNNCLKNILVFPSWNRYNQVIDYLDQQSQSYYNAYVATLPVGFTEADFEAGLGVFTPAYDEDNRLMQFENNFTFCSLRKKLNILEEAWLNAQGDGAWNLNDDPDEHFIDDYTERALLNEGVEVIIGPISNRPYTYTLYKFFADGSYYTIPLITANATSSTITNTSVLTALQQINSGTYVAGSNPAVKFNPPVVVPPTPNCKNSERFKQEFGTGSNSRIKTKQSYRHATFGSAAKIIITTKHRKKRSWGGWTGKPAWINASYTATSGLECGGGIIPPPVIKTEYKRRVVARYKATADSPTGAVILGIPQLYHTGTHQKESYNFNIDLYNGQTF